MEAIEGFRLTFCGKIFLKDGFPQKFKITKLYIGISGTPGSIGVVCEGVKETVKIERGFYLKHMCAFS